MLPEAPVAPIAPAIIPTDVVPELPVPIKVGAAVKTILELFAVCEATVLVPRLIPRNKTEAPADSLSEAKVTCVFFAALGESVIVE